MKRGDLQQILSLALVFAMLLALVPTFAVPALAEEEETTVITVPLGYLPISISNVVDVIEYEYDYFYGKTTATIYYTDAPATVTYLEDFEVVIRPYFAMTVNPDETHWTGFPVYELVKPDEMDIFDCYDYDFAVYIGENEENKPLSLTLGEVENVRDDPSLPGHQIGVVRAGAAFVLDKGTYYVRGDSGGYNISIVVGDGTPAPDLSTASDWAKDSITAAIGKGFVPADLQGEYTNTITRAEFCRLAVKWVEYKTGKTVDEVMEDSGVSRDPDAFTDTDDEDILAAFALGITSGAGDNKFNPGGAFTREQAAGMIKNVCAALGEDVSDSPTAGFDDANEISAWTVDGVNYCVANGIMRGGSGNMFSPKNSFTREMSIMTFDNME